MPGQEGNNVSSMPESGGLLNYIPGRNNPVADALSRVTINDVHIGIDYQALSREQQQDPQTDTYNTTITKLK